MKKIFTITLLSFLFFACQNDSQTTDTAVTTDSHEGHDHGSDAHAGHNHGTEAGDNHVEASALSPFIGKWLYYAAISNADYYKGKYIDFYGNGTFLSGVDGVKTNSGTWTYDEVEKLVDIDYSDNSKEPDEQWRAQNQSANVIIFMGNTPKNPKGNQIKLERVPR